MAFNRDFQEIMDIIQLLETETKNMEPPASVTLVAEYGQDPFIVLIACLLSLRTKDTISLPASRRLFYYAHTPGAMVQLSESQIQKLIYPVAFYRRRAHNLIAVCAMLIEQFDGKVPQIQEELMRLPGVGLKTANLVLSMGFSIPALCVDTHVHRISNRFGLVHTKTPEETERALQQVVPREYWITYCNLLVMWGQNVCKARGQKCKQYALASYCHCP